MAIEWSDDLSVGSSFIDGQHKELFKAVNDLMGSMWEGKGAEQTSKTLEFLSNYVVEHFGAEERLMLEHNYPEYSQHKMQHTKFIEEFSKFKADVEAGNCGSEPAIRVLDGTCDWLRNHISRVDRRLGLFLQTV
jgi:hemerythrin